MRSLTPQEPIHHKPTSKHCTHKTTVALHSRVATDIAKRQETTRVGGDELCSILEGIIAEWTIVMTQEVIAIIMDDAGRDGRRGIIVDDVKEAGPFGYEPTIVSGETVGSGVSGDNG